MNCKFTQKREDQIFPKIARKGVETTLRGMLMFVTCYDFIVIYLFSTLLRKYLLSLNYIHTERVTTPLPHSITVLQRSFETSSMTLFCRGYFRWRVRMGSLTLNWIFYTLWKSPIIILESSCITGQAVLRVGLHWFFGFFLSLKN